MLPQDEVEMRSIADIGPELAADWQACPSLDSIQSCCPEPHSLLIQEFYCVKSAQDPPADSSAGDRVDNRDVNDLLPADLPLLPLDKLILLSTL